MAVHGGFAAAVAVRESVLEIALLAAYANGSFSNTLSAPIRGGPPEVDADLFVGLPTINCEGATNLLVLTLSVWGPLRVTMDGAEHLIEIVGELEITIRPVFLPGSSITLSPTGEDVVVRRWTASVTSEGAPPAVVSHVVGAEFKERLQETIRLAVDFRLIAFPAIDVSFFGALATQATSVGARVRSGVLLLGLNVATEDVTIVGDEDSLIDFARSNDLAGVVNRDAVELMLAELHTRMVTAIEDEGASLDEFEVRPAEGFFEVTGAASKSSGTVNFSFRVVPRMFHTHGGAVFSHYAGTDRVNSRTWAALTFHIEGVDTDVDRSWWVVALEILGVIFTAGMVTLYIEDLVSAAGTNFSGRVSSAQTGMPSPRVRRTIPPEGGVAVRVGVDQFEIDSDGTYVGISVRAIPTTIAVFGPTSVPSTYRNEALRYSMRLPSTARENDTSLRINWRLEDRTTGVVLVDSDGPASGRIRFEFSPDSVPTSTDFGVIGRLYRRLGPTVTELGTESVNVQIRGGLQPGAYVRWQSAAWPPQISLDEATAEWQYHGRRWVTRWSKWHRVEAPCRALTDPDRSSFMRVSEEKIDILPFPLRRLETHRHSLCTYCFFGGSTGLNAML